MALSGIHHAALSVANLERSLDFYCRGLGFRKTLEMPVRGPEVTAQLRLLPGMTGKAAYVQGPEKFGQLELIEWSRPAETIHPPKRPGDPGVFLLSFEIPRAAIAALEQHLMTIGAPIYAPLTRATVLNYGEIDVFVVEDPDGVLIEIVSLPTREEILAFRAKGLTS